ncbi:10431_t:CDS:2 [Entrophospora sp. SA101]|nr:6786_t:CDS:2 [Entrophospora sp. SA101]CAJ0767056.1 10431_t:CDS:2 [Entrophospora sp. SA101]
MLSFLPLQTDFVMMECETIREITSSNVFVALEVLEGEKEGRFLVVLLLVVFVLVEGEDISIVGGRGDSLTWLALLQVKNIPWSLMR